MVGISLFTVGIGTVLFVVGWVMGFITGHSRGKMEAIEEGLALDDT